MLDKIGGWGRKAPDDCVAYDPAVDIRVGPEDRLLRPFLEIGCRVVGRAVRVEQRIQSRFGRIVGDYAFAAVHAVERALDVVLHGPGPASRHGQDAFKMPGIVCHGDRFESAVRSGAAPYGGLEVCGGLDGCDIGFDNYVVDHRGLRRCVRHAGECRPRPRLGHEQLVQAQAIMRRVRAVQDAEIMETGIGKGHGEIEVVQRYHVGLGGHSDPVGTVHGFLDMESRGPHFLLAAPVPVAETELADTVIHPRGAHVLRSVVLVRAQDAGSAGSAKGTFQVVARQRGGAGIGYDPAFGVGPHPELSARRAPVVEVDVFSLLGAVLQVRFIELENKVVGIGANHGYLCRAVFGHTEKGRHRVRRRGIAPVHSAAVLRLEIECGIGELTYSCRALPQMIGREHEVRIEDPRNAHVGVGGNGLGCHEDKRSRICRAAGRIVRGAGGRWAEESCLNVVLDGLAGLGIARNRR